MKHATFDSFLDLMGEMGRAFAKALRYATRAIATMSWPALLVTCVALALALTIVPLALSLFVVFMAIKLIVAAIVLGSRRRNAPPHLPMDGKGE